MGASAAATRRQNELLHYRDWPHCGLRQEWLGRQIGRDKLVAQPVVDGAAHDAAGPRGFARVSTISKRTPVIVNRRTLLSVGAATLAAAATFPAYSRKVSDPSRIKALAFDAFSIFDLRPIALSCEKAFPGRGTELSNAWRTRQFEYQWLRALAGQYADFWQVTGSALDFAAQSLQLDLSSSARDVLMQGYLALQAWPDVPGALTELRHSGRKLVLLSNATEEILRAGIKNSELDGMFHEVISTDRIKCFKPDPRAYQLGVDILRLRKEEIMFVAFAGWDVAGSKWFGYPTFWNNRQNSTAEQLGVTPDGTGASLDDLTHFLSVPLAKGI
jgi:2-haloacid dehalogenase